MRVRRAVIRRRDQRPLQRRETDMGFSYLAPVGPPPPRALARRGCLAALTAGLMLLLGIGLIAVGSQYGSIVGTSQSQSQVQQGGHAVGGGGALCIGIALVWLLGLLLLRRRRLRVPLLPRMRHRRRDPVAEVEDSMDDLF